MQARIIIRDPGGGFEDVIGRIVFDVNYLPFNRPVALTEQEDPFYKGISILAYTAEEYTKWCNAPVCPHCGERI